MRYLPTFALIIIIAAILGWLCRTYNPPYSLDLHNPIVGMGSQGQS